MKVRKFDKKLSLNKTTVSNLSESQLNDAKGGIITIGYTCETCDRRFCPTIAPTLCVTCPINCD
jgi:natural product precursor